MAVVTKKCYYSNTSNITICDSYSRMCVFWDVQEETWSDFGCEILQSNVSHTKCSCQILNAYFAILAVPEDPTLVGNGLDFGLIQDEKKEAHKDINTVITVEIATYLVSSICLLIIIILLIQVSFNTPGPRTTLP